MPRRFSNLPYGPHHLRPFLRARLAPGERIVGWGRVQVGGGTARVFLTVALGLVPGVGHLLAAIDSLMQLSKRRLLVLTDRRLLMLRGDNTGVHADGRGVVIDVPLPFLRVLCGGSPATSRQVARAAASDPDLVAEVTQFTVQDRQRSAVRLDAAGRPGLPQAVRFSLPRADRTAAERLREALVVLAQDQDQEAAAPSVALLGRGSLS